MKTKWTQIVYTDSSHCQRQNITHNGSKYAFEQTKIFDLGVSVEECNYTGSFCHR